YFSLPERFLFIELTGLNPALQKLDDDLLEIIILLDEARPALNRLIDKHSFALNCTPAINLFEKRADRIHLDHKNHEHHLLVDRTRPRDYEVYSVKSLTGYGSGSASEQSFRPLYSSTNSVSATDNSGYYTVRRQPAMAGSTSSAKHGLRSDYHGSEMYLALVDANEAPYRSDLKQLGALVLCTNRDLPQYISPGQGKTDFTLEINAPVNSARCIAGPTAPKASYPEGEYCWRLINHLSTNYLTLQDNDQGAEALRQLLSLYGDFSEAGLQQEIEGLVSVSSRHVVRRLPVEGPMAFGRGVEITLSLDESFYKGSSAFLFSGVMERFLRKYASINSFTQTVVKTRERGEIMRWPMRLGSREV
ncbi:MAG: type VI secretion system baseplate subunit TssF, partial [Gammaproteobacteria bacterium]|nr:type VI secretion system baseplate subunit TssF [Gammaproteobacteria bacterium]